MPAIFLSDRSAARVPYKGQLPSRRHVDYTKVRQAKAAEDSPPGARLKEAGAMNLGLTTSLEWGGKGVTDSPATGKSHRSPIVI